MAVNAHSAGYAVALIVAASLLAFLTPQTCWVPVREIVPAHRIGAAGGMVHLLANLAGLVSPSLTGWFVQYGGRYSNAFYFVAALTACGVFALLAFVREGAIQGGARQ